MRNSKLLSAGGVVRREKRWSGTLSGERGVWGRSMDIQFYITVGEI